MATPHPLSLLLLTLPLLSCAKPEGGGGKDNPTTGTTVQTDPCEAAVAVADPADGELDVPIGIQPGFTVSPIDPDATVSLRTDGDAVPGSVAIDGDSVTFTPDEPLDYSADYEVEVSWLCGEQASSFTTEPVPNTTAYRIDQTTGVIVEPAGIGGLVAGLLEDGWILFDVLATGGGLIDARLGHGGVFGQDMCVPTSDTIGADFGNEPSYDLPFEVGTIGLGGGLGQLDNVHITGTFTADLANTSAVDVRGRMDVEPLGALVGGDVCELLETFGVSCQPCPSGPVTCLPVHIAGMNAGAWQGELVERTPEAIAADPACP